MNGDAIALLLLGIFLALCCAAAYAGFVGAAALVEWVAGRLGAARQEPYASALASVSVVVGCLGALGGMLVSTTAFRLGLQWLQGALQA